MGKKVSRPTNRVENRNLTKKRLSIAPGKRAKAVLSPTGSPPRSVGKGIPEGKRKSEDPKKLGGMTLPSYTIQGSRKIVKVGDCVLIQAQERNKPPYVARIEKIQKIQTGRREKVVVKVRWFYHPEETISGRRSFHGEQEVCLSDHYDTQDADTIQDKCVVHTYKNYSKLTEVDKYVFFWRFEYKAAQKVLSPEVVDVYCVCEMPYNPDHFMVQCETCLDWFHPSCVKLSQEQVAKMEAYKCAECSTS